MVILHRSCELALGRFRFYSRQFLRHFDPLFFAQCFESMPTAASTFDPIQIAAAVDPDGLAPLVRVFFRYVEESSLQSTWSVGAAFGGLCRSCLRRVLFSVEDLSVRSQGHDAVFVTSFADLRTKFGFSDRNICEKWVLRD